MNKTPIISVAAVITLGLVGYANSGEIAQAIECTGDEIQYEYDENYYCGSNVEYTADFNAFKLRLTNNELKGEDDVGLGQIIIWNDDSVTQDIANIYLAKYDKNNKRFNGLQFDSDVFDQGWLLMELTTKMCGNPCNLPVTGNITEDIYQLLLPDQQVSDGRR
jgi:hypothetical protein